MKIAVFYYTQSGQALTAIKNICKPIEDDSNNVVVYKEIVPEEKFPFPWDSYSFWDTMPETRMGTPPSGIEPLDFSDIQDADLVIVVGQSWFLSPSLPIQSFFLDKEVKNYLNGRNIVFVNACRNMWLMTKRKVKKYIEDANAHFVGHIVLQDENYNLVSVITIIRWLVYGKKEATRLLPPAGIADDLLEKSSRFGEVILKNHSNNEINQLQQQLLDAGAIHYKPFVSFVETVGHRMFGFWCKFISNKGGWRDPRRRFRLRMFSTYLMTALFVVSPIGKIFYYLTYPFQPIKRFKDRDCNI